MTEKILVFDVETTGLQYWRHCIHQLSGMIVIDGEVKETFDLKIRPHEQAVIDEDALKICGVTKEQILAHPHRTEQFRAFKAIIGKYVDIYNADDKMYLLGFNNSFFDNEFLRNYFVLEGDTSWGAHFWQNILDTMVLASYYLMPVRHTLPSFKLSRVAKYLGIPVDDTRLHDSLYDCWLTFEVYKKVRGHQIQVDDWANS